MSSEPSAEEIRIASLARCPLFATVPLEALTTLARGMRARRFARNEVIFHQGDPGDALYVITAGSVKILLPSAEGDEAIIATLHPGDFFGELAILDREPRSATAKALEATETWQLPSDGFRMLLDTDRGLRDALLTALSRELRRLTGHVEELHFLDLAGRLASRLVRLAADAEPAGGTSVRLNWPYTQSDLASMIGGTRQSVNRLLSGLEAEGLVRLERDLLIITDVERLAARADR
jgi:CRP/FNR family cyclic AMP-dependent transcriptional regulator